MLEKYSETQKNFYETVVRSVLEHQKVSHAYFIETNGFSDSKDLAISFAKFLLCTNHHVNNDNCSTCNICHLIDEKAYSDLKIIEPDGQWIKKEQLLQLQSDFKTKSFTNGYRIYIINGADRLNKSAANSMLKFLEEPEDNIIAILLANNRYQVINTILSRCQILRLVSTESTNLEHEDHYLEVVVSFAELIETKGVKTIAYLPKFWNSTIKTKDDFLNAMQFLANYYESMLSCYLGQAIPYPYFFDYKDEMLKYVKNNTLEQLTKKLYTVYHFSKQLDYNLNQNLLIDKLVIELCGGII